MREHVWARVRLESDQRPDAGHFTLFYIEMMMMIVIITARVTTKAGHGEFESISGRSAAMCA